MPQIGCATNGSTRIAYEAFGDPAGEPLLLVMGLDYQMVWWPEGLIDQLATAGFAVVRFDNRDTGLSTKFESPPRENPFKALLMRTQPAYTTPDMVNDMLAVMDAIGWLSATVMGGSKLGLFPKLARLGTPHTRDEHIELLVAIMRTVASPHRPYRLPPIEGITAPTLVIQGEDDPMVEPRAGRDLARRIPGARLVTYPGMGHDMPEAVWPLIVAELQALTHRHG